MSEFNKQKKLANRRDWAVSGEKNMDGILELLYIVKESDNGDFIEY